MSDPQRRENRIFQAPVTAFSGYVLLSQISAILPTARKHLQHVFERLQVNNRAAAVARAFSPDDLPLG